MTFIAGQPTAWVNRSPCPELQALGIYIFPVPGLFLMLNTSTPGDTPRDYELSSSLILT